MLADLHASATENEEKVLKAAMMPAGVSLMGGTALENMHRLVKRYGSPSRSELEETMEESLANLPPHLRELVAGE